MRKAFRAQRSLFNTWPKHPVSSELQEISAILDELPELNEWVLADLVDSKEQKFCGARGMTAEQVLRAAILKQQNNWSYEYLSLQCADSSMTQSFLRLNEGEVYSKSCLHENVRRITAQSWQKINDHLVQYCADQGIEKARTIRMDATAVNTCIHPPSDSSLIYDCVRVSARALKKLRNNTGKNWYLSVSTRQAKHLMLKVLTSANQLERKSHYRVLIRLAQKLLTDLDRFLSRLEKLQLSSKLQTLYEKLVKIYHFLPIVISQTKQRVLKGLPVPVADKVVSIFEEHTDIIVKGKRETEFGHKAYLVTGKTGLILDCNIKEGNPSDKRIFIELINRQQELFARPPRQSSADGGFASKENVSNAKRLGVKDVCFSKRCGLAVEDMVKSPWVFQKLRNFRAGIEGVISILKRVFGWNKVTWKGWSGFESFIHSTVVSYNLTVLARLCLR